LDQEIKNYYLHLSARPGATEQGAKPALVLTPELGFYN